MEKDGVQIIPVSEIAAKDDFANIKNITRDDVLASLRIPPQLMGIVPNNSGGFGSVTDAEDVFYSKEIVPLQSRLSQINELTGIELIRFKEYDSKKSLKSYSMAVEFTYLYETDKKIVYLSWL